MIRTCIGWTTSSAARRPVEKQQCRDRRIIFDQLKLCQQSLADSDDCRVAFLTRTFPGVAGKSLDFRQNCNPEIILGGEVPEEAGLGDANMIGNRLSGQTTFTQFGQQTKGHFHDFLLTLSRWFPGSGHLVAPKDSD